MICITIALLPLVELAHYKALLYCSLSNLPFLITSTKVDLAHYIDTSFLFSLAGFALVTTVNILV